jgi:hypothetical protein
MDFTQEFWHTATVAWACGIISVLCAVEAYRQRAFRLQLIGGVLAGLTGVLCPATLTRGYYEMVVVNQELAAVVAAKRAEGIQDERIVRLVASDVVESRGGRRYERADYSDGTRASWLRDIYGRTGPVDGRTGQALRENRLQSGPFVAVPKRQGAGGISWH